ncbi:MAG: isoprenylcysteine carboxylmethyltransferase family protein [Spirochaetes bacterium]|nr:isoprenylcysteine carboxylmethyltransferase family protein [Spirochaetota bacterium]
MILKFIITITGFFFWIVLLPVTIAYISFYVTYTHYTLPPITFCSTGIALSVSGLLISLWAVVSLIVLGKGTPIPMYGPQKLIISGPYRFCRNPMTLGLLLYYIGAGMIIYNLIAAILLIAIAIAHMIYDKYYEERELIHKFGDEYIHYKKITPFIVPKLLK